MGGVIGTICVGLFATTTINSNASNGLFYGGSIWFFLKQIAAILLAVVYSFSFTLLLLKSINWLIPVKASAREEKEGFDISYHGEIAEMLPKRKTEDRSRKKEIPEDSTSGISFFRLLALPDIRRRLAVR